MIAIIIMSCIITIAMGEPKRGIREKTMNGVCLSGAHAKRRALRTREGPCKLGKCNPHLAKTSGHMVFYPIEVHQTGSTPRTTFEAYKETPIVPTSACCRFLASDSASITALVAFSV